MLSHLNEIKKLCEEAETRDELVELKPVISRLIKALEHSHKFIEETNGYLPKYFLKDTRKILEV